MRHQAAPAIFMAVAMWAPALWCKPATAEPAPAPTTRATDNPTATLYRDAFQRLTALGEDDELDLVTHPNQRAERRATFLAPRKEIVAMLIRAGTMPPAEWEDPGDDITQAMRAFTPARRCSRLLTAQVLSDLENKRPAAAVDAMLAHFALSRNVGRQGLLVSRLVEAGIQSVAAERIALSVAKLPRAELERLRTGLVRLPAGTTLTETYRTEKTVAPRMSKSPAFAKDLSDAAWDVIIAHANKPPVEFAAALGAESGRNINPLFRTLSPSIIKSHPTLARIDTEFALLVAGITVALDGPRAAKTITDAFGPVPVKHEKTNDGFELSLQRSGEDTPITLTFQTK